MSLIDSFLRREKGFGFFEDYKVALSQLRCHRKEVYTGVIQSQEASIPILATEFCTTPGLENFLALADEDGHVGLQRIHDDCQELRNIATFEAHNNVIFDIAWMPKESKLLTVSADHSAQLFDVTTPEPTKIREFVGHQRSVKTAVFAPENKDIFATGSRNGIIMIWDVRANQGEQGRPDNSIEDAHCYELASKRYRKKNASKASSVTSLAFLDEHTLLSCAAGDGSIKAWDLRKNYMTCKKRPVAKYVLNSDCNQKPGFSSLIVCPFGITVYASSTNGIISAYNSSSDDSLPIAEYFGHMNKSYYVRTCLSPDGKYIISGSTDEFAYIWGVKQPGPPLLRLKGHSQEVTCVNWCPVGQTKIITCADDTTCRIWRIGDEKEVVNEETEIRGRAEPVQFLAAKLPNSETTPTTRDSRIRQDLTPSTGNTSGNPSSLKRTFEDMNSDLISESRNTSVLSPIDENEESVSKRPHIELRGPRRLFMNVADEIPSGYKSDGNASVSSLNDYKMPFSPTSNLPNFVIDGTAPHLLERSPMKCKENCVDWLTKLRQEKAKSSVEKPSDLKTPVNNNTKRAKSMEPGKSKKDSPVSLLKYFKINNQKEAQDSKTASNSEDEQPTTSKNDDEINDA